MAVLDPETLHGIAQAALRSWSIPNPRLQLISLSENTVFRVALAGSPVAALRIHRPDYHDLDELNSECLWTQALQDAGVEAPLAIPTEDGRLFVAAPVPGTGEERLVGLVEWVEGATLRSAIAEAQDFSAVRAHFEALGRIAARIHNQAGGWRPPAGFRRPALDAEGLLGARPLWGPFWEHPALAAEQRRLMLQARRILHKALTDYGKSPQRYGLIHADLHPENLIAGGDRLTVIDFDDAGYGWHAYELAVAVYHHLDHPNFNAIVAALAAGYREVRPLDSREVDAMPHFLTIRSLARLGWVQQRRDLDSAEALPNMIELACRQCESLLSQPNPLRL